MGTDKKLSELASITGADVNDSDIFFTVDVSEGANEDKAKSITAGELKIKMAEDNPNSSLTQANYAAIIGSTYIAEDNFTTVIGTTYLQAGRIAADDGDVDDPGFYFTNATNYGVYRSGSTIALGVQGQKGLEIAKSAGSFANIGMGGSASVSDSFPLLIERDVAAGVNVQVSNPSATATSFTKLIVKASSGSVSTAELAMYNNGYVFVDAYDKGRMVLRVSGTGQADSGISLVADDASNTIRGYCGGVAAAGRVFEAFGGTDNNHFQINGGLKIGLRTITSSDVANGDDYTILGDASGGVITVTLPDAGSNTDKVLVIKKIDASNNVVIDGSGTQTIDGAATVTLSTQYHHRTVHCDGSNWHVIGSN
jgi:hypothetical protein